MVLTVMRAVPPVETIEVGEALVDGLVCREEGTLLGGEVTLASPADYLPDVSATVTLLALEDGTLALVTDDVRGMDKLAV